MGDNPHWEPHPNNTQILRRAMAGLEFRVFLDDDKRWSFTARGNGEYVYRKGYANLLSAKASACKLAREYAAGKGTQDRTGKQGFASVDPEQRRKIASMGGKAAHSNGTTHRFTSEEAREAGKRGGKAVARDRAYMAEIGRRGGVRGRGKPKLHYKRNKQR